MDVQKLGVASKGDGSNLSETPDASLPRTSPSLSLSPQSPMSPDMSVDVPDFTNAIGRQELLFRAEKVGLEELHEARVRVLQEQLLQAQTEIHNLRNENCLQKEMLQNSGKALSEFKNKYDIEQSLWTEQRAHLEKEANEIKTLKKKYENLTQSSEQTSLRLLNEESLRVDVANQLSLEQKDGQAERAALMKEIAELKKSLGHEVKDDKSLKEVQKILKDIKAKSKDIKSTLQESEKHRESEIKKHTMALDVMRKDWERDKKVAELSNTMLNERAGQLPNMQRQLIDMKYRLHSSREAWLRERSELQRQVDEARRAQLGEKNKIIEIIAEVKRVKTLMPQIDHEGLLNDAVLQQNQVQGSRSQQTFHSETRHHVNHTRASSEVRSTSAGGHHGETHRSETVIRLAAATSTASVIQERPFLSSPAFQWALDHEMSNLPPGLTAHHRTRRRSYSGVSSSAPRQ